MANFSDIFGSRDFARVLQQAQQVSKQIGQVPLAFSRQSAEIVKTSQQADKVFKSLGDIPTINIQPLLTPPIMFDMRPLTDMLGQMRNATQQIGQYLSYIDPLPSIDIQALIQSTHIEIMPIELLVTKPPVCSKTYIIRRSICYIVDGSTGELLNIWFESSVE